MNGKEIRTEKITFVGKKSLKNRCSSFNHFLRYLMAEHFFSRRAAILGAKHRVSGESEQECVCE